MNNDTLLHSVRTADKPNDEIILRDIFYYAVCVPPGAPLPGRDIVFRPELIKYVHQWGRPGDEGLLLVDENHQQLAGAVWSRLFSEEEQGYGFVDADTPEFSIALRPEYRGQGFGTQLLKQFLTHLARKKYHAVSLSVSPWNPAVRLYRRFGFQEVESRYDDALTMVKQLL